MRLDEESFAPFGPNSVAPTFVCGLRRFVTQRYRCCDAPPSPKPLFTPTWMLFLPRIETWQSSETPPVPRRTYRPQGSRQATAGGGKGLPCRVQCTGRSGSDTVS